MDDISKQYQFVYFDIFIDCLLLARLRDILDDVEILISRVITSNIVAICIITYNDIHAAHKTGMRSEIITNASIKQFNSC